MIQNCKKIIMLYQDERRLSLGGFDIPWMRFSVKILCFSHSCYLHYYGKHEKDTALPLFLRLLNYLIGSFLSICYMQIYTIKNIRMRKHRCRQTCMGSYQPIGLFFGCVSLLFLFSFLTTFTSYHSYSKMITSKVNFFFI